MLELRIILLKPSYTGLAWPKTFEDKTMLDGLRPKHQNCQVQMFWFEEQKIDFENISNLQQDRQTDIMSDHHLVLSLCCRPVQHQPRSAVTLLCFNIDLTTSAPVSPCHHCTQSDGSFNQIIHQVCVKKAELDLDPIKYFL